MDGAEIQAQLEELHRESYGWALGCCGRDPAAADVVLQTVYLKVLEGKARFGGDAAFKTWLFAVIRNTAADHARRRILRKLRLMRYQEEFERAARAGHADDAIYNEELQAAFQKTLAALAPRQREVLQLVFYHDLTLSEAAEVMGIGIGSARTHYDRGKRQLRKLIAESKVLDESGLGREENQSALS